jgi:hypothetical protein
MPAGFNKWHCFISNRNMVLVLLDHVAVLELKVAMCDYTLFLLKHCLKEILQLQNLSIEPMSIAVIYNPHQ